MESDPTDIQLFNETELSLPINQEQIRDIVTEIQKNENCLITFLEVVFVDEEEIITINKEHLGHDYVTDIITFRYDENQNKNAIEATLFCCAPRIFEQAKELEVPHSKEFARIVIHGLLHLAGYKDAESSQKKKMRTRENLYLSNLYM